MNKSTRTFRALVFTIVIIAMCYVATVPAPVKAVFGDCVAYDSFTRADGAVGTTETTGPSAETCPELTWTGASFTISGNDTSGVPTVGSDVSNNGDAEGGFTAGKANGWTKIGTPTLTDEIIIIHGGSHSQKISSTSQGHGVTIPFGSPTVDTWYQTDAYVYMESGGSVAVSMTNNFPSGNLIQSTNSASWVHLMGTGRYAAPGQTVFVFENTSTATVEYVDDVTFKPLTTSTLFASVPSGVSDNFSVQAKVTRPSVVSTCGGIIVSLDSAASPANFVIAYISAGGNVRMDKVVAGTYTNLINSSVTYSAGAPLRITKVGTNYSVFYNGTQVGATQSISDAGITSNTLQGLFSTDGNYIFDNFHVMDFTPTPTPTSSNTPTNTSTPTPTNTPTATPTHTYTPSNTATGTSTDTPTSTPTDTPTSTVTSTPTNTSTPTRTPTRTPYPTRTPANMVTAFWDGTITYGDAGSITVLSIILMVMILFMLAWLVTTFLQRRRRS